MFAGWLLGPALLVLVLELGRDTGMLAIRRHLSVISLTPKQITDIDTTHQSWKLSSLFAGNGKEITGASAMANAVRMNVCLT